MDFEETEKILSLKKYPILFNGSSFNLFLLASSAGYVDQILVGNDIMQNKSDAVYHITFSNKEFLGANPLELFSLNDNQPFDPLSAQKNNEECIVI